jgi:hypothetical protein
MCGPLGCWLHMNSPPAGRRITAGSTSAGGGGRTRIQHLDLDTRIVPLPTRIDRIARRASRDHTADVPGVLWSAMHAGSEIACR